MSIRLARPGATLLILFVTIGIAASMVPSIGDAQASPIGRRRSLMNRTIIVDDGLRASDDNAGGWDTPLRTVRAALERAHSLRRSGIGVRIRLRPGVYPESLMIASSGDNPEPPLVVEAVNPGTVTISGADVWRRWRKVRRTGVFVRAWPYNWGLAPVPDGWDRYVQIRPIARRREMVFVNGRRLIQVLSRSSLRAGTFYVSELRDRVYMRPPRGTDMTRAVVEVARRSRLLRIHGADNVTIRGLQFSKANPSFEYHAVQLTHSQRISIENNRFVQNNWGGLSVCCSTDIDVIGNTANRNGGIGMAAYRSHDLLFDRNETSYNNWRGAAAGYNSWSVAGFKNMLIHDSIYRRHVAVGNLARGLWFDTDVSGILVEEARLSNNATAGLFVEALQGPFTLRNSTVQSNGEVGVLSSASERVNIEDSTICGNGVGQIIFSGDEGRSFSSWMTNESVTLGAFNDWTLRRNKVISLDGDQLLVHTSPSLMSFQQWRNIVRGRLLSDENMFIHPVPPRAFGAGTNRIDLPQWRSITGEDGRSVIAQLDRNHGCTAIATKRASTTNSG